MISAYLKSFSPTTGVHLWTSSDLDIRYRKVREALRETNGALFERMRLASWIAVEGSTSIAGAMLEIEIMISIGMVEEAPYGVGLLQVPLRQP